MKERHETQYVVKVLMLQYDVVTLERVLQWGKNYIYNSCKGLLLSVLSPLSSGVRQRRNHTSLTRSE